MHASKPLLLLVLPLFACWTGPVREPADPAAATTSAPRSVRETSPDRAVRPPRRDTRPARDQGATPGCDVTTDAPVRMTSDAELRVEVPPGDTVVFLAVTTRGPQSVISKLHLGSAVKTQMPLPPGAYSIEVKTSAGLHVRCTVPLVAGAETTVRVAP